MMLDPLLRFSDDWESSIGDTVSVELADDVDEHEDDDDDDDDEDDDDEEEDDEDESDVRFVAGGVVGRTAAAPSTGCTVDACCAGS